MIESSLACGVWSNNFLSKPIVKRTQISSSIGKLSWFYFRVAYLKKNILKQIESVKKFEDNNSILIIHDANNGWDMCSSTTT